MATLFDLGLGAAVTIVLLQVIQSTTDWTAKRVLGKIRTVLASETTSRDDKEGNQRALEIERRLRKRLRAREEELSDYERMIRGLRNENISKSKIIEQYWKPLPSIIITFFNDYEAGNDEEKFLKNYILENNDAEMLTGQTYAIPPKGFPPRFDRPEAVGREEIREWIEEDILGQYPDGKVVICQASAVDLRRIYSYSDYETHSFNRKTIEQALDIETILDENNVHRILAEDKVNLSKAIENGDLAFLLSRYVSNDELEQIHRHQDEIQEALGNPSLRRIAEGEITQSLADSIGEYVDMPEVPAKKAVEEAKLWHQHLQN